ncbi:MAG: hypothetical protein C0593_03990 [Marinilabiliales bacterium]|nr:MAG: hypothetical protein C0593_03990 [Marinilabiliales bacterium]
MKKFILILTVMSLFLHKTGFAQQEVDMLVDSTYLFSFSSPLDSSAVNKKLYDYTEFDSLLKYRYYRKYYGEWDYRTKHEWQYYDDLRLKKFINTDVGEYADIQTYTYTGDYVSRIDRNFDYVSDPCQASGFTEFDSLGRQRLYKFRWSDEWRGYEINSEHDYDELNRLYHYYYDKYSWTPNSGSGSVEREEFLFDDVGNVIMSFYQGADELGNEKYYYVYQYEDDTLVKRFKYIADYQWPYDPSVDHLVDSTLYFYADNKVTSYSFGNISELNRWDTVSRITLTTLDTLGSYVNTYDRLDYEISAWLPRYETEVHKYNDLTYYDSSYKEYYYLGGAPHDQLWYREQCYYNEENDSSSVVQYAGDPTIGDWRLNTRNLKKEVRTEVFGLDYERKFWKEEYNTSSQIWTLTNFNSARDVYNENGQLVRKRTSDLGRIYDDYYIIDEWGRLIRIDFYEATLPDSTLFISGREYYYYDDYNSGINDGPVENVQLWFNNSDETIHHPAITKAGSFSVFDLSGRVMTDGNLAKESTSFNLSGLQSGTYIAAVFDGEKKYTLKFFVR